MKYRILFVTLILNIVVFGAAWADEFRGRDYPRLDVNSIWTPDELIAKIEEFPDKVVYVHWRWEEVGNNSQGDEFLVRIMADFPEVDEFIVVELFQHTLNNMWKKLVKVPAKYNRSLGKINSVPAGSFIVHGQELRYLNPTVERGFYEPSIKKVKQWISVRKQESG